MSYKPERCCTEDCEAMVQRRDGNRCGGLLHGTRDQAPHTCGAFTCDRHLAARGKDVLRCPGCLARRGRQVFP